MSQPDRSPDPGQEKGRGQCRDLDHDSPQGFRRIRRRATNRRPAARLACALSFILGAAGCGSSTSISNTIGDHFSDPGCVAALHAVSTYGPSAVEALAEHKERVNREEVHLLVLALDAAAETANRPADKQAISALAGVYEQFDDLQTTVVAVPLSTMLKDTTALDVVCKS